MKHAFGLIILLISLYVVWQILSAEQRAATKSFVARHFTPPFLIVIAVLGALVALFYLGAPQLL